MAVMLHDVRWHNVQLGPVFAHVLSRSPSGVDVVLGLDTLLQMGLKIGWHQGQLPSSWAVRINVLRLVS